MVSVEITCRKKDICGGRLEMIHFGANSPQRISWNPKGHMTEEERQDSANSSVKNDHSNMFLVQRN